MAINVLRRSLFEQMMDLASIKSGLILPQSKAITLLNNEIGHDGWWSEDLDSYIRIHMEDYEDTFLSLLTAVGYIADSKSPMACAVQYTNDIGNEIGVSPNDKMAIYQICMEIQNAFIRYMTTSDPIPNHLLKYPNYDKFKDEYFKRHIYHESPPPEANWSTPVNLSTLFDSESVQGCEKDEAYFDQRFIEYLDKQKCDIADIHWRQFEYLTGEFFHRSGYSVTIGKGRGDGGIDVVAIKENDITGPEKIFVQCKKYKKTNHIQLDSVRAFWATISDEQATKGIIATTSCLTKGSQEYCKARLYRLAAAEGDKVENWIGKMKNC